MCCVCVCVCVQFASCKEELLRLLEGYLGILERKALPYAVEIKVYFLCTCRSRNNISF